MKKSGLEASRYTKVWGIYPVPLKIPTGLENGRDMNTLSLDLP